MRAVIQRVSSASVTVDGSETGSVGKGLCVLLGVGQEDTEVEAEWMADKISKLRIFEDEQEKLNLSVEDVQGGLLVISQFTLYGDCRKGRRPSFVKAAEPRKANQLYEFFVQKLKERGLVVSTGIFQAHMKVNICNDGPVTIILDSPGGTRQ